MLEEILRYLNNWFVEPEGIRTGTFSVENGGIVLPFLRTSQYFRVVGSTFNDGLYQYPAEGLTDELFEGAVWALAVPKAVVALADEISAWNEKNGTPGPFTSESFGGYSYSKAVNSSGVAVGWQDVFKSRLNSWRRIGGI